MMTLRNKIKNKSLYRLTINHTRRTFAYNSLSQTHKPLEYHQELGKLVLSKKILQPDFCHPTHTGTAHSYKKKNLEAIVVLIAL